METPTEPKSSPKVLTYRFKVRTEANAWLNRAAIEVNQVWNYCNRTSFKAAVPFYGKRRWLTGFDLCNLTSGSTKYFEHIGADSIQRVCQEYALRRAQFKRAKLRWRTSFGPKRSRGWIPLKSASIRRHGKYLRFLGKTIRIFESERFMEIKKWGCGNFSQDSVGDWWLSLPVEVQEDKTPAPALAEVGIDLGLTASAVTSDGERLPAGRYYRDLEPKIKQAQRRKHLRQSKRLNRRVARRRKDALHKFTRSIVARYYKIAIGDVSSLALAKTRLSKAVLDSSWGELKRQLLYKGGYAGRVVQVVNERNTTRSCSSCGALTGPKGVNGLRVREWVCQGCGASHDRDVNAARMILLAGRKPPSMSGNEVSPKRAPPSRASRPRKARTALASAAS